MNEDPGGAATPAVRDARPEDAEAIGRIHVRCWRHAYAGLVPQQLLDGLDEAGRIEQWRGVLTNLATSGGPTLVVLDAGGEVAGFAQVGAPTAPADTGVGVLYAIYLRPDVIGAGLGRTLLAAATERLSELGFTAARLEVLANNARARHVYEAAG